MKNRSFMQTNTRQIIQKIIHHPAKPEPSLRIPIELIIFHGWPEALYPAIDQHGIEFNAPTLRLLLSFFVIPVNSVNSSCSIILCHRFVL